MSENTTLIIRRLREGLNRYGTEPQSDTEKQATAVLRGYWEGVDVGEIENLVGDVPDDMLAESICTTAARRCKAEDDGAMYEGDPNSMLLGNTMDEETRRRMTGGVVSDNVGCGPFGVSGGGGEDLRKVVANDKQIGGDHYRTVATRHMAGEDEEGVAGADAPPPPIQHWDFVWMHRIPYHEAQVIRYIMRHAKKNGAEDVRKAIHFCEKILELYYGEGR